jgi:hypothetical protein
MFQVEQDLYGFLDNVVRLSALDIDYEARTTSIVLVARIV